VPLIKFDRLVKKEQVDDIVKFLQRKDISKYLLLFYRHVLLLSPFPNKLNYACLLDFFKKLNVVGKENCPIDEA